MNEWKTYKLGDVAEKIGSGATPKGGKEAYLDFGEISLIRSQNVWDFSFSKNGLAYISEEQAHGLRNVIIKEDDILLNITGDSVARVCQVPVETLPARVNQHVAIIRGKKEVLNQSYLKYYLLEPSFKKYMLGLASAGATRNALTKVMIENFEIKAPEIDSQNQIASILSSLDDKIELNLRMNQTLEAMAQAIFKEWFVNFNFPGFDGKLVEGLPKKWRNGLLGEIISFKNGKSSPERNPNGKYPVFGSNDIIGYADKYNTDENSTIIGRVGSYCGSTYFSTKRCWVTDNAIIAQSKHYYASFAYLKLLNSNLNKYRAGSGQPLINQSILETIPLVIPSNNIIEEFESIVMPFFKKIELNNDNILGLTITRDRLLPKLMTGKIEIKHE